MRHVLAHKVFDRNVLGPQLFGKSAVVVDERIVRAADFFPLSYFSAAPGSVTRTSARTVTNSIVNAATSADAMWISPVHQT